MRSDIILGAIVPEYELSDHTATRRKLFELQGQHPVVLVLSRGGFCPKDRRHDGGLVELHRELEVAYCRLVTVSTDDITETNEYRSGVGAGITPTLAFSLSISDRRAATPRPARPYPNIGSKIPMPALED